MLLHSICSCIICNNIVGALPRRSCLCRVPATHGERTKAHGESFAVRLRTTKTTRQRRPRQRIYVVYIAENPHPKLWRALKTDARQSKAGNGARTSTEITCGARAQFAVSQIVAVCSLRLCRELWFYTCPRRSLPWACTLPWASTAFAMCRPMPWACPVPCAALCREHEMMASVAWAWDAH
jgi:hypothetical protein